MSYIEDFNKYVKDISDKYKDICDQLSKIDGAKEDLLHFLEFGNYDAITMTKVTKKLKEIMVQRRKIKYEYAMIQKVQARLGSKNLTYTEPDTYTCRTDVLNGIISGKKIKTKKEEE